MKSPQMRMNDLAKELKIDEEELALTFGKLGLQLADAPAKEPFEINPFEEGAKFYTFDSKLNMVEASIQTAGDMEVAGLFNDIGKAFKTREGCANAIMVLKTLLPALRAAEHYSWGGEVAVYPYWNDGMEVWEFSEENKGGDLNRFFSVSKDKVEEMGWFLNTHYYGGI